MKAFTISLFVFAYLGIMIAAPARRDGVDNDSASSHAADTTSSVYIHPSFVIDRDLPGRPQDAAASATVKAHWEMPFSPTADGKIMCGHNLTRETEFKNSRVEDCLSAMNVLLGLHGYWETKGWREAPGWHRFFGYATCNVWLLSIHAQGTGGDYGNTIR